MTRIETPPDRAPLRIQRLTEVRMIAAERGGGNRDRVRREVDPRDVAGPVDHLASVFPELVAKEVANRDQDRDQRAF